MKVVQAHKIGQLFIYDDKPMTTTATHNEHDTTTERALFVAFELSEKTWNPSSPQIQRVRSQLSS